MPKSIDQVAVEHDAHLTDDALLKPNLIFLLMVIAVEVTVFYQLFERQLSIYTVLKIHGLVVVSGLVFIWYGYKQNEDLRFPVLTVLFVATTGPLGGAMMLVIMALYWFFRRDSMSFEDWYQSIFPQSDEEAADFLYDRLIQGWDDMEGVNNTEPFRDILTFGSLNQKQQVLTKITRFFQPKFAPLLQLAINDESNAVRVQAATAMAKIEQEFMRSYLKLRKDVYANPNNIELLEKYARLCDDYAYSGLLDDMRQQQTIDQAIESYEQCVRIVPDSSSYQVALARLYIRSNKIEKARLWLEECMQDKKRIELNMLSWYIEVLFRLHKFSEIRRMALKLYKQYKTENEEWSVSVLDMLKLWARGIPEKELELTFHEKG